MKKSKNFNTAFGMIILVLMMMLFVTPVSSAIRVNKPSPICATENSSCAREKALLRKLERTQPSKKMTRKQIFNQIKASCARMRSLDCPDLRNSRPLICFTDF